MMKLLIKKIEEIAYNHSANIVCRLKKIARIRKTALDLEKQLEDLMTSSQNSDLDFSDEIKAIESKIHCYKKEAYADLTPWQKVQLSRHPNRHFH